MTKKSTDGRLLLEVILVDANGAEIDILGGKLSIALPADAAIESKQDDLIAEVQSLVAALASEASDRLRVTITDENNSVGILSFEGVKSLHVVPGLREDHSIHLNAANIEVITGFMLVDLSDTDNWPHSDANGYVILRDIYLNVNPNSSFRGDVEVGFLTDVGATDGDFNSLHTWHFGQAANDILESLQFAGGLACKLESHFGPVSKDDTLWQNDLNLLGPDGNVSYPSGEGDVVMRITRTAGSVNAGIMVRYDVVPLVP